MIILQSGSPQGMDYSSALMPKLRQSSNCIASQEHIWTAKALTPDRNRPAARIADRDKK
jgi:hypothetical protein